MNIMRLKYSKHLINIVTSAYEFFKEFYFWGDYLNMTYFSVGS
jgi:hypothetical protein